MMALYNYVEGCGVEKSLRELVYVRASQINGWNRLMSAFRVAPAV